MRFVPFFLLLLLMSAPAAHAFCERAWVARNMIFDRAGHCFGSTLGQIMFNNADCIGTSPVLSPADQEAVNQIRGTEQQIGCRINTAGGPNAEMQAAFAEYSRLIDIPAIDHLGFACWGYLGPPAPLRAGASFNAPIIGQIETGQSASYQYWPRNGWNYVHVSTGPSGVGLGSGWVQLDLGPDGSLCEMQAG